MYELKNYLAKSLLYTKLADYYDLFIAKDYELESKFIVDVIEKFRLRKVKLIDLGCGTARHIKALSKVGFQTQGLDISEEMLRIAQENSPGSIFTKQDMRDFHLRDHYNVAMCLGTSFNYLLENEDFVAFRESLKRNKIKYVILDSSNFSYFRRKGEVQKMHKVFSLAGEIIEMEKITIFEKKLRKLLLYYKFTNTENNKHEYLGDFTSSRTYSQHEVEVLMKPDYKLIASYGDYNKSVQYTASSPRMILVFKLKA